MPNPFHTIREQAAAARAGRPKLKLRLPKRITDTGAPSTRATDARDARVMRDQCEAQARRDTVEHNGDYFTYTRNGPRFTSTKR